MPKISNAEYEAHLRRLANLNPQLHPEYYYQRLNELGVKPAPEYENYSYTEGGDGYGWTGAGLGLLLGGLGGAAVGGLMGSAIQDPVRIVQARRLTAKSAAAIKAYEDEHDYYNNFDSRVSETRLKINNEKNNFKHIEEYVQKLDNTPNILCTEISNSLEAIFDTSDHHFINHTKDNYDKDECEFYIRLSAETKLIVNHVKSLFALEGETPRDRERRKYFILYKQLSHLLLTLDKNSATHTFNKLHNKLHTLEQAHNLCFDRYVAIEQAAILPASDMELDTLTNELCNTMLNKAQRYSNNPAYQGPVFDTMKNIIMAAEQDLQQNVPTIDKFKFTKVLEATTQVYEPKNNLTNISPAQKLLALSNSLPRKYKTQQLLLGATTVLLIAACLALAVASFGASTPLSVLGIAAAMSLVTSTGSVGIASGITLGFLRRRTATTQSQEVIDTSPELTRRRFVCC